MLVDVFIVTTVGALVGVSFGKKFMQGPEQNVTSRGLAANVLIGVLGALFVCFALWSQDIKVGDGLIGSSITTVVGYVLNKVGLPVSKELLTLLLGSFFGATLALFLVGRYWRR